jgi:hypothetical protein
MTTQPFVNPFLSFLDEDPQGFRASFFNQPGVGGGTPAQSRFFQDEFQRSQNKFLGALASQIESGQAPTLTQREFLGNQDFNRLFRSQAPGRRGLFDRQFAPGARFSFF